ncbi:MAG: hypothetical protein ABIF85_05865 [Nanoarchaeota archaeon]
MANGNSWKKICGDTGVLKHDFSKGPFPLNNNHIKIACQDFKETGEKEVRILCKQDTREQRPSIFKELGLFLLPIKNGKYIIVKGEGYVDIPEIKKESVYISKLDFDLETSKIGNSEMQHLDFAFASSLIRTFMEDPSLVLTIRGRKYTPKFSFKIGDKNIDVEGVQTEVDAGYEGKKQIVLIEAKSGNVKNTIIRQLYYPYRQWSEHTKKPISLLFFESKNKTYYIWQYEFTDKYDYNSIRLVKSEKYQIVKGEG